MTQHLNGSMDSAHVQVLFLQTTNISWMIADKEATVIRITTEFCCSVFTEAIR